MDIPPRLKRLLRYGLWRGYALRAYWQAKRKNPTHKAGMCVGFFMIQKRKVGLTDERKGDKIKAQRRPEVKKAERFAEKNRKQNKKK